MREGWRHRPTESGSSFLACHPQALYSLALSVQWHMFLTLLLLGTVSPLPACALSLMTLLCYMPFPPLSYICHLLPFSSVNSHVRTNPCPFCLLWYLSQWVTFSARLPEHFYHISCTAYLIAMWCIFLYMSLVLDFKFSKWKILSYASL